MWNAYRNLDYATFDGEKLIEAKGLSVGTTSIRKHPNSMTLRQQLTIGNLLQIVIIGLLATSLVYNFKSQQYLSQSQQPCNAISQDAKAPDVNDGPSWTITEYNDTDCSDSIYTTSGIAPQKITSFPSPATQYDWNATTAFTVCFYKALVAISNYTGTPVKCQPVNSATAFAVIDNTRTTKCPLT